MEQDLPSILTPKSGYLGLRLHKMYRQVHWRSIAKPMQKPTVMAPGPRDMASTFLKLPAELRLRIYEKIIHSVPAADPPTHAPLAFQQIFLDKRVARIGFHDQIQGWLHNCTDYHPVVALLVDNYPSFGIYPNTINVHELGPLTNDQIARVKRGRKGRNQSRFLHAMKLLAVAIYQADFYDTEHHPDIGEDYQVVAMNWAWEEVAMKREEMVRWAGVDWRDRVFYGS